ncbi:MAG TPA: hypothetical protein VJS38_17885 [Phenylobacterium sp.]|uniref:hypothetical protein n=1 Tax=Phenylobacterium sp. TaxID=1871053 RepID=UPI002B4A033E|nr:hypothetical protein [Phenylobacterium sp.]HKR90042.1 hypothetical protein [Phenylobacterium sp.]
MLRFATLAAAAAVLVAGPAAAESIHVSTVGKSSEQVKAEIQKAAVRVCRAETSDSQLAFYLQAPCVRAAIKAAVAQSSDPALQIASR